MLPKLGRAFGPLGPILGAALPRAAISFGNSHSVKIITSVHHDSPQRRLRRDERVLPIVRMKATDLAHLWLETSTSATWRTARIIASARCCANAAGKCRKERPAYNAAAGQAEFKSTD